MATAVKVAALFVATALGAIALVHVYWGVGGRAARQGAIPERDGRPAFEPSRAATLAVALALVAAAALVALGGRLLPNPLPATVTRVLVFGLGGVLIARAIGDFRVLGFFKSVRTGAFARRDSWLYSPLCLVLGVATLGVGYFNV